MNHNSHNIYGAYRTTLRSMSGGRAGERKQRALKIVADRYKTPSSQVKAIVRENDAVKGITHEAPKIDPVAQRFYNQVEYLNSINDGTCHLPTHDETQTRVSPENNASSVRFTDWAQPLKGRILLSCFACYVDARHSN